MNIEKYRGVHREMAHGLAITRHGLTRHWAVWEGGELLTVTLHLKGARAIARRLAPHATPTRLGITVAAIDTDGRNVRLMMCRGNDRLTHVCHGLRGAFHSDYRCPASIAALLETGSFTLRSATGQKRLATYLNKQHGKNHA